MGLRNSVLCLRAVLRSITRSVLHLVNKGKVCVGGDEKCRIALIVFMGNPPY